MPIQYVINECWFYRYPFFVNEYCLIPRPETEELVLRTMQQIEQLKNKPFPKILDIGTGSGCISISLKKELQHCRITSIDIFPETLKVAKRNARKLGAQIDFLLDDILHPASYVQQQCFDLIVSNPPYIPLAESVHMHKNVLDYEPHSALFVQDDAPLLFYRAIAELGIKNKATVCCEISENLGTATVDLFRSFGYGNIVLHRDLQGKDRVIVAQGW
jgi:release factor glutamine methyltransferase